MRDFRFILKEIVYILEAKKILNRYNINTNVLNKRIIGYFKNK